MTPESFIYWLNGFMEIADPKSLDEKQLQVIKDHIALVLKKETPIRILDGSELILKPGQTGGEIKVTQSPMISISECVFCKKPNYYCNCLKTITC